MRPGRWLTAIVALLLCDTLAQAAALEPNHAEPVNAERVYVYRMPGKFNRHIVASPRHGTSEKFEIAMERRMHQMMLHHPNRTMSPANATLFFVPVYPVAFCGFIARTCTKAAPCRRYATSSFKTCPAGLRLVHEAVQYIRRRWTYWNRHTGADHVLMAFSDQGVCMANGPLAGLLNRRPPSLVRALFLTLLGAANPSLTTLHPDNTAPACFQRGTDVVVPPSLRAGRPWVRKEVQAMKTAVVGRPRTKLCYYRGSSYPSIPIRVALYKLTLAVWTALDLHSSSAVAAARAALSPEIFAAAIALTAIAPTVVLNSTFVPYDEYLDGMGSSLFCLVPPGYALWSFRLYEAILAGCIPVMFDDHQTRLPFDDSLDWEAAVVRIPSANVANTLELLAGIDTNEIKSRQVSLHRLQLFLSWGPGTAMLRMATAELGRRRAVMLRNTSAPPL